MINYAREDTHYLLYIYECMKKSLVECGNEEKNLLKSAFSRSSITCLRVIILARINIYALINVLNGLVLLISEVQETVF